MMTRPYDVERGIHELFHARANGDLLMAETGRLADKIADGFRADFDVSMDMETAGKALVILAASLTPLVHEGIPSPVIANMIGFAGENLVRTARVRAREAVEVWRSVGVDGHLAVEDAAEADIVEAFAVGDRVLWNPCDDHSESATVQSVSLLIRLDDNGQELVAEGRHCRAATQPGDFPGEEVDCETVLTWHPVAADPVEPIEVPLNQHIAWCPEELGEFRVSTREVQPADESPEVSGG